MTHIKRSYEATEANFSMSDFYWNGKRCIILFDLTKHRDTLLHRSFSNAINKVKEGRGDTNHMNGYKTHCYLSDIFL